MDDYLMHYGILGMKWGVRRYQNPDGSYTPEGRVRYGRDKDAHTINKGTVVYRTSSSKDGRTDSKHMYVTYTDIDRSLYSGTYSKTLAKNQTGNKDSKMYENSYTLKEDLRVPSKETVDKIMQKMSKDPKSVNETSKAISGAEYVKEHLIYLADDKYITDLINKGKTVDDYNEKEAEVYLAKEGETWAKKHAKQFNSMSADDIFLETAQSLGTSDYNRNKVINELKKMGYNAMIDEAGVGYNGQEGIEPLIIFDKDQSIDKHIKSKELNTSSMRKSDNKYDKWSKKQRN